MWPYIKYGMQKISLTQILPIIAKLQATQNMLLKLLAAFDTIS